MDPNVRREGNITFYIISVHRIGNWYGDYGFMVHITIFTIFYLYNTTECLRQNGRQ
jgi:hypothetical protein